MSREEMLMHPDEYRVMFEMEDAFWWYRGLRVLLKNLLARHLRADTRQPMILDAGCGTGANLKLLESYGDARGVDISEQAIAFCRQRGIPAERVMQASVTELPFRDGFFDMAVSFDVICNIVDDVGAFAEIGRVLKPDGIFVAQLPAYRWLWSRHDVAVGHKWRYTARTVREKLSRAGFALERLTHVNTVFFPFVATRRVFDRRALENGHKIRSEVSPLPRPLNGLLSVLYRGEMQTASHIDLPYGLSIVAVARKK
jgi:SAM-dependent methyltransferase